MKKQQYLVQLHEKHSWFRLILAKILPSSWLLTNFKIIIFQF